MYNKNKADVKGKKLISHYIIFLSKSKKILNFKAHIQIIQPLRATKKEELCFL